MIAKRTGYIKT